MSVAVDTRSSGQFTLAQGKSVTIHFWWNNHIAPGEWYRLAPSFPGGYGDSWYSWTLPILTEGIFVDKNGTPKAWIKVQNNCGSGCDDFGTLSFVINALSGPSH